MPRAVHVLCQEYEHRVQNCSGLDEVARQWLIERGTYCHEIEKKTCLLHTEEYPFILPLPYNIDIPIPIPIPITIPIPIHIHIHIHISIWICIDIYKNTCNICHLLMLPGTSSSLFQLPSWHCFADFWQPGHLSNPTGHTSRTPALHRARTNLNRAIKSQHLKHTLQQYYRVPRHWEWFIIGIKLN